jgi:hypothetical protein
MPLVELFFGGGPVSNDGRKQLLKNEVILYNRTDRENHMGNFD